MKLTKSKLKQIIKEELGCSLNEISYGLGNPPRAEGLPIEGGDVGEESEGYDVDALYRDFLRPALQEAGIDLFDYCTVLHQAAKVCEKDVQKGMT